LAAQEGSVEANYTVSALGQIEDLSLSSVDSTNPDSVWFRNHAEIAMRGWRIEPAKRANGPVRATRRTVFKFKLE
jgi:outer membrane biosynthesis protein TonB